MASYTIEVEVDDPWAPGMQPLADAVADLLERKGAQEHNYNVTVNGLPELRVGFVDRGARP
jgi:hypothetical protein